MPRFPLRKIGVQGIPCRLELLSASWLMSIHDQHISRRCCPNTSAPAPGICLSKGSSLTWEGESRLPWMCICLSVPEIASAALTVAVCLPLSLFRYQMACVKTWFENQKRTRLETYHFKATNTSVRTNDRTTVSEIMCPHGLSLFKLFSIIVCFGINCGDLYSNVCWSNLGQSLNNCVFVVVVLYCCFFLISSIITQLAGTK